MKLKMIVLSLVASALFGQSPAAPPSVPATEINVKAKPEPKDATIKALETKVADLQAQLTVSKNGLTARDIQIADMNAIYFARLNGEINKSQALATEAGTAAAKQLAESCKETGGKLATDALTCPPTK